MMNPSIPQGHGLRWSPWFRHIVDSLLIDWWRDLDATLTTDVCVDLENIHRFWSGPCAPSCNMTWGMRTQASLLIYPHSRQQFCHICACFIMLEMLSASQLDWPWGTSLLISRQLEKSTRSLYRIDREFNRDSVRRSAAFSCKATAHCIVSPQNVFKVHISLN